MDHHIQPEDTGLVFTETQPRLAVFTHIVSLTNGQIPPVSKAEIMERARATYDGPMIMGEDLTVIRVGKDEVIAKPWSG